jgi:hypothetical protein
MKVHFDELFTVNNGAVSPKTTIHINGITMTPSVSFGSGVSFGGTDLTQFIGKFIDVEQMTDGVYNIKGVYN